MTVIPFKRGSTFKATVSYVPGVTDPADLSSTTVTSDVRDKNGKLYVGTVVKAMDNLSFTVTIADTVTTNWPIAFAEWDVKFSYAGVIFYTDTVNLDVSDHITP
jgi:hypothetical protein